MTTSRYFCLSGVKAVNSWFCAASCGEGEEHAVSSTIAAAATTRGIPNISRQRFGHVRSIPCGHGRHYVGGQRNGGGAVATRHRNRESCQRLHRRLRT